MGVFQCVKCGYPLSAAGEQATVTCPSCGAAYTLAADPPDWGSFFWGTVLGFIFGFFVFTATGKAIMEALGYRVLEKIAPKE